MTKQETEFLWWLNFYNKVSSGIFSKITGVIMFTINGLSGIDFECLYTLSDEQLKDHGAISIKVDQSGFLPYSASQKSYECKLAWVTNHKEARER